MLFCACLCSYEVLLSVALALDFLLMLQKFVDIVWGYSYALPFSYAAISGLYCACQYVGRCVCAVFCLL